MKVLVMILQPVDLQLFPLSRMHQRLHHRQIYLPPQRIQQRQHHNKQQQLNLTSRHWNQLLNLLLWKAIFLILQVIFWFLDISEVVIRPLDSSLDSKKLNLFIKDNDILRSCATSADCSNQDPGIQEMCFFDFDYRYYNNSYYYDVYYGFCEPCPGETDQDCFDRYTTTDFGIDECLNNCVNLIWPKLFWSRVKLKF